MNFRFKAWMRDILVSTPVRHLAEPVYDALTALELRFAASLDRLPQPRVSPVVDPRRVTAIIKTFERPSSLARLVRGIQQRFPGLRIVVADDSREASLLAGVELLRLPFDSGVSAGRQAALDQVTTEFTWSLDDDFVLYRGTQLALAVEALDQHSNLDLVGGPVVFLPLWRKRGRTESAIYPTDTPPRIPLGTRLGPVLIRDKVPNFFVARTARLRQVGWTPELKRLDHADFFTRARGVLSSGFLDDFRCLHAQTPFDRDYQRHRRDYARDEQILRGRYNLD